MNRSIVMKTLAVAASTAVLAALAGAVAVLGSPMQQRQRALDNLRLSDLGDIVTAVKSHAKEHNVLPQELSALKDGEKWRQPRMRDPDTNEPYGYKPLDDQSFQLCAVFSLPSSDPDDPLENRMGYRNERRPHAAGRQCFTYTRGSNTE
jgi:hypothetical protein